MLLALVTVALAQEPAATADATITITKPKFAAPAPPPGRKVGVGVGYALGWDPIAGSGLLPHVVTMTFRGPRFTWTPSLHATLGFETISDGATGVNQSASGGVWWYPTVTDPEPLSIRPSLCAGGGVATAVLDDSGTSWSNSVNGFLCAGMHVQRWLGSRFSVDLSLSGVTLGLSQTLAHDAIQTVESLDLSLDYVPSGTVTVSMYFDRARNPE